MKDKKDGDEKELFSSLKDLPGGSNDNLGKAMLGAAVVGILGVIVVAALGIKGGLIGVIPALLAILVFKAIRNK